MFTSSYRFDAAERYPSEDNWPTEAKAGPKLTNEIPHAGLLEQLWDEHGDFGPAFAAWMERMAAYAELQAEYDVDALEAARSDYRLAVTLDTAGDREKNFGKRQAQRHALLKLLPSLGLEATARYVDEPLDYVYGILMNGRTASLRAALEAEPLLREARLSWTAIANQVGLSTNTISTLAELLGIKNPTTGNGGCHTYTPAQRDQARRLWTEGWGTHKEIADEVGVPRTAVVGWCRNIKSPAVDAAKARRAAERAAEKPRQDFCKQNRASYLKGCRCGDCGAAEWSYQKARKAAKKCV